MSKRLLVMIAAALFFFVSACGGDSYGRSDAIDDMVEGGLPEEQANCIADGAEEHDIPWDATEDAMGADGEYGDAIAEIIQECLS